MNHNVHFIDRVGGEDTFRVVTQYLKPWERIALRAVCLDFNRLHFVQHHGVEDSYHYLETFWRENFARSVIQLYCRPLLDYAYGYANFFKYHTLLKLSTECWKRVPRAMDRLNALKYCLKYQDQFAKSPLNLTNPYIPFSKNMRELEGLYINNRTEHQSQELNHFMTNLLENYSKMDNARFRLLFFNHCTLGDIGMRSICRTIMKSPIPFALEILFFSNDESLGDQSVGMLLDCVETNLTNVNMICLRNTGITNVSCDILHAFYRKHYQDLCQCQVKMGQNEEVHENEEFKPESEEEQLDKRYSIRLKNINITFNRGITSEGIRKLNELFFLDDDCTIPHRADCFFSSVAIGTSVSLDGSHGIKLSSRFRFLNQSE